MGRQLSLEDRLYATEDGRFLNGDANKNLESLRFYILRKKLKNGSRNIFIGDISANVGGREARANKLFHHW